MKVLALELSSSVGSVAFGDGENEHDFKIFPADRKDSGLFYENLSATLASCGAPEIIVVGLGPGSYAGVRIAIATALGLRAATGARLLGLPSIIAIEEEEYAVVGDARRNSFYFAHVAQGRCLEGPTLGTEEEVRARLKACSELPLVATQPLSFANLTVIHPSALRLTELARAATFEDAETLEPIYLREPYITTPGK